MRSRDLSFTNGINIISRFSVYKVMYEEGLQGLNCSSFLNLCKRSFWRCNIVFEAWIGEWLQICGRQAWRVITIKAGLDGQGFWLIDEILRICVWDGSFAAIKFLIFQIWFNLMLTSLLYLSAWERTMLTIAVKSWRTMPHMFSSQNFWLIMCSTVP